MQILKIFPNLKADRSSENAVISVTGRGATKEFSALIANEIPDLEMISKGQCFPMNLYEIEDAVSPNERTNERTNGRTNEIILHQQPDIPNRSIENLTICLTMTGSKGFSVLMTDTLPDLHLIGDAQCFPMFLYETEEGAS